MTEKQITLRECIELLATVPHPEDDHSMLDISLVQPCREFAGTDEEALRLLRDTLDKIVRYALGVGIIIELIRCALKPYPESEESKTARREAIEPGSTR